MNEALEARRASRWGIGRAEAASLLLIVIFYVAGAAWFAAQGAVWSPDNGARLLQVQAILEHGPQWWVRYPAEALDPQHQNSPLFFFGFDHGGRTYVFYSFLFAHLSAFFYKYLGFFGLSVLPMLGGLGAALATLGIARLLKLRFPVAPMLLTALATPIVLFSIVFWDHSITTGIATGVLCLALRGIKERRPWLWFAAGALLGLGLWLHEILLPYLPALVVGAWWTRRHHRWIAASAMLGAGVLALVIPLALINKHVYGTPAGPHLANNNLDSPGAILGFMLSPSQWGPGALYTLFGWGDTSPAFTWQLNEWLANPWPQFQEEVRASVWMAVPALAWIVLSLSGWWRRLWWLGGLAFVGVAASCLWVLAHDRTPHGTFLVCPLLLLAFGAARPRSTSEAAPGEDGGAPMQRLLAQTLALVTAIYVLLNLAKPTLGGIEWGARHLLSVVPALSLLAWSAIESLLPVPAGEPIRGSLRRDKSVARWQPGSRPLVAMAAAMVVLSVAMQIHGVRIVHAILVRNRALTDDIARAPDEVIVSTVWWAPVNAAPAYNQKKILFAGDDSHPALALMSRLSNARVRTFTLLATSPDQLSGMSGAFGYVPIPGAARPASQNLYFNRFILLHER